MNLDFIKESSEKIFESMVSARRHLHKYPEIGREEFKTQQFIIECCESLGVKHEKIAGTGVLAIVEGKKGNGKVVAFRSDIDALPITETNTSDYCSLHVGCMHACGHDVHTATNLGVMRFFKENEDKFSGSVKFFFQPAEENFGGAKPMIKEGCMENPDVDYVLGFHVMPYLPYDKLELKYDTLNASTDTLHFSVLGKAGHGAYPDLGVDAIVISAQIITALQSVVSRNVSPLDSAVVTIGKINGGTATNIICNKVDFAASVRASSPKVREIVFAKAMDIAKGIATSMGGDCEITIGEDGYAPLVNHNDIVDVVAEATREAFGEDNIDFKRILSMGGEDFSYFIEHTKGAFYSVGCKVEGREPYALHTVDFDVDERCMKTAFISQVYSAVKLLGRE